MFPETDQPIQQIVPVLEMPIKTASRDGHDLRQTSDAHRLHAFLHKQANGRLQPVRPRQMHIGLGQRAGLGHTFNQFLIAHIACL